VIKHDLRIYKDIGYLRRRNETARKQPSEES
jgi:hypothetical protein